MTVSNAIQLFPLPTVDRFLDAENGYNLLKNGSSYIVANGSVLVPLSGAGSTLNLVLLLNAIQSPIVPLIAPHSDAVAILPAAQPVPVGLTEWSLVCRLSAQQQRFYGSPKLQGQLRTDYVISVGGVPFSGTLYSSNDPFLVPVTQFSIGVQFTGSLSGSDVYQASLFQFQTQK